MIALRMRILILLVTSTLPMHSTGRNLHGKYRKRSTESQGGVGSFDDGSFKREDRIPDIGAVTAFRHPDDVTFKQEDINPVNRGLIDDAFKPFDDVTRKREDLLHETGGDRVKVSDDAGATPGFAFNLPSWLMFFQPIWGEIVAKENDLRVQFPTEFESENDNAETGIERGWTEGGVWANTADAAEIDEAESAGWAFGEAAEVPEMPEHPGIFEAPENNFEWAGSEIPEPSESFIPDDTENLQQGVDNSEQPEAMFEASDDVNPPGIRTEIEHAWNHDSNWNHRPFGLTGNWMQGMVNTAMGVLHGQQNGSPHDDAAERLNNPAFESPHSQEEDQDNVGHAIHDTGDIEQPVVNHDMMLMNPFARMSPAFVNTDTHFANVSPAFVNTETSFNSQFEHHNAPDNEQDSSS